MNIVDRHIIHTIKQLDRSVFDGFSTVPETINEFDSDSLYAMVVLLLWECNPSVKSVIVSKVLPQSMTQRFRTVSYAVDAIKALGVRDPLDYHTLLYGSSKELRNILIGLIEKLPKVSVEVIESKGMHLFAWSQIHLLASIKNKIHFPDYLKDLVECAIDYSTKHSINFQSKKTEALNRYPFIGLSGDLIAALRLGDQKTPCQAFLCAIIESNSSMDELVLEYEHLGIGLSKINNFDHKTSNSMIPAKPQSNIKPALPPKPTKNKLHGKQKNLDQNVPHSHQKFCSALNRISLYRAKINGKRVEVSQLKAVEAEQYEKLEKLKIREKQLDDRLLKLLKSSGALVKLTNYIDDSSRRMENLQNRWVSVQSEKIDAIKSANQSCLLEDKDFHARQKRNALFEEIESLKFKAKEMHESLKKMQGESDSKAENHISRSLYIKHIFDIVQSILKQQEEINKIWIENKQLQRSIISLAGKRDRTFTVVEDRLHQDVIRDSKMQKSYRLLIKIHEEFMWVMSAIDSCGKLESQNEEIAEHIVMRQQMKIKERLECLLNDCEEVKKEHTQLSSMLLNK